MWVTTENIRLISKRLIKFSPLLFIFLLFFALPLEALFLATAKQNWRVINNAPFQITPAASPLNPNGETLQALGFNNINALLTSIEKKTVYRSVAFSPDGHFIVSGSEDSTVKLWDIQKQKLAHTFEGHTSYVTSVAFSNDGRFIVSGSYDNTVKLWDIQQQKLVHTFVGHASIVKSVTFSNDGRFIASGSGSLGGDNSVKLWDIQNQKLVHTFKGHTRGINSVSFSNDSRFIASGSLDNSIKLWDIQNQKLVHTFKGHSNFVFAVAFSSDGRYIASGSDDNTVKLWDIQNLKLTHSFKGHSNGVNSVAFSNDKRFIASGSDDNTIKLWDIQNHKLVHTFEGHTRDVNSIAFSNDGHFIASSSYDKSLKLWDIQNQKLTHTFEGHSSYVTSVAFSNDGRFIAAGSVDNTIKLGDIQKRKLTHTFAGHSNFVTSVTFTNDGRFIASGSDDNTIKLWDIQKPKLSLTFEGHTQDINSVAFDNNGRFIISGSDDKTIKLWDIQNQKLVHTFKGHASGVNSVAFSNDGHFIASGANDNTIKLWDIQSRKLAHTYKGHSNSVNSVAFSKDGRFIASGAGNIMSSNDNTIKLWDIQNHTLAHTFEGHTLGINSISFSNDGLFLASGSYDNTIKLWDIKKQELSHTFEGHASYITSTAFSHDGSFIASGSYDNTIKLWDIHKSTNFMTLLSSRVDSWLLIKNNNLVFRAEHGNLLRKKAKNDDWEPVRPTNMQPKSDLSIWIKPSVFSISAGKENEAELEVQVRNTGSTDAFWLKLKPGLSKGGVVRLDTLNNQLKPKGQSVWKTSHITRLEAGKTATLHARLSTNLKLATDFISPGKEILTVTVISANGSKANQDITVDVALPRLEWTEAALEPDGNSIKVTLQNTGTADFRAGFVQLVANGLDKTLTSNNLGPKQFITQLSPGEDIELAFVLPRQANLMYLFKLLFHPELLHIQGQNNQLPIFSWNLTVKNISWLLLWFIAFALLLVSLAVLYLRRYRHPLLLELSNNPDTLLSLPPEQLSVATKLLQKTGRLNTVLSQCKVSSRTLRNGINFFSSDASTQKIKQLENRLGTQAHNIQANLWKLPLPQNFPLNLQYCLVYFAQKNSAADDVFTDLKAIAEISRSTTLLIGPDSEYQQQLHTKSKDPSNKFVAPSGVELTQLLLSSEPETVLAEILAGQLALTLLSPYQLGGGVNNTSVFFGREEIIDHILNREPANYLLAGGRQLGKSSLLKALDRRFQEQGDVSCFYLALSSEVLIPRLISQLKLPKQAGIDALAEYAEKSTKRLIFLIDEADKFIRREREHDYQILNTLRQISEEGHCHFILAGFWELYQHAVLDYQSPLKNFAETIQVGALESAACRQLATRPMQSLRLEYASPELVERLLQRTGGRANLIAIVCHQIIEHLGSNRRIINAEDINLALHSDKTLNALRGWGAMSDDQHACRLDRIIVYATVEKKAFSLDQLLETLNQHQLTPSLQMIEHSLERLELGFVLGREQHNLYVYQVPLFLEMILNESPASKLRKEINDWNMIA